MLAAEIFQPAFVHVAPAIESRSSGKERDIETGLDYFGARYYGSNTGRWMSPDWSEAPEPVPFADLNDPQTLNLYGYVRNNPLSHADPDGHCCWEETKASAVFFGQELVGVGKGLINAAPATYNAFAGLLNEQGASSGQPYMKLEMAPTLPINNLGEAVGAGVATLGLVAAGGAEVGGTPKPGAGIVANAERGAASEARVLNDLGVAKNTKAVVGSEGKSIPDFQTSKTIGEIKDVKQVSNTMQLRIQKEAAQQSGRQHELHTGTRTTVTKNAAQGTKVVRRDDLGPRN